MTPEENADLPDEATLDRDGARNALASARASSRRADTLINETRSSLSVVRSYRETNHFADKLRATIRGTA